MSFEQNCDMLRQLSWKGFLKDYVQKSEDPAYQKSSHDDALGGHLCAEVQHKDQIRYERLKRGANLKYPSACPEHIDYISERGLIPSVMSSINALGWVDKFQNVFFIGATGTGKSYLSCALAHQCIRKGITVKQFRVSQLLEHMELCRGDGSLAKFRTMLNKTRVLFLDDVGSLPISARGSQDLLEVIEARTTSGSLIITSQLPVEKWHQWLGEPTVADAILDRLIHRAHIIQLKGESMRKLKESVAMQKETNDAK